MPALRSHSMAFASSPPASLRARLQSIIGRPVFSRSDLTDAAEISGISSLRYVVQIECVSAAFAESSEPTAFIGNPLTRLISARRQVSGSIAHRPPRLRALKLLGGCVAFALKDCIGQL